MTDTSASATPSASQADKTVRRRLLEEAADLIDGDRNHTYGSPTENFKNISEMWNVRFKHLLKDGQAFTASDVADAMIIVKVARGIANKTRDTYADIAGYAGCGEEIRQEEQRTGTTAPSSKFKINFKVPDDLPESAAATIAAEIRRLGRGGE